MCLFPRGIFTELSFWKTTCPPSSSFTCHLLNTAYDPPLLVGPILHHRPPGPIREQVLTQPGLALPGQVWAFTTAGAGRGGGEVRKRSFWKERTWSYMCELSPEWWGDREGAGAVSKEATKPLTEAQWVKYTNHKYRFIFQLFKPLKVMFLILWSVFRCLKIETRLRGDIKPGYSLLTICFTALFQFSRIFRLKILISPATVHLICWSAAK